MERTWRLEFAALCEPSESGVARFVGCFRVLLGSDLSRAGRLECAAKVLNTIRGVKNVGPNVEYFQVLSQSAIIGSWRRAVSSSGVVGATVQCLAWLGRTARRRRRQRVNRHVAREPKIANKRHSKKANLQNGSKKPPKQRYEEVRLRTRGQGIIGKGQRMRRDDTSYTRRRGNGWEAEGARLGNNGSRNIA